jgi:ubiquinone/menaquinone biosynthesis C-methylase UbiE
MSLHDIDDLEGAVCEISRVLQRGGRVCIAVVHPVNSAGHFEGGRHDGGSPFVIPGSYLEVFGYHDYVQRDGLASAFTAMATRRVLSAGGARRE